MVYFSPDVSGSRNFCRPATAHEPGVEVRPPRPHPPGLGTAGEHLGSGHAPVLAAAPHPTARQGRLHSPQSRHLSSTVTSPPALGTVTVTPEVWGSPNFAGTSTGFAAGA